jgi:hypothetical protein
MRTARMVWAALVGTFVAVIFGALFDYVRVAFNIKTESLILVYPWVSGIGGLVSAMLTLLIYGIGQPAVSAGTAGAPQAAKKPAAGGKAKAVQEVPGMPSFDFNQARADIDSAKSGTALTAAAPPAAPAVEAPPATEAAGSRPAAAPPEQLK